MVKKAAPKQEAASKRDAGLHQYRFTGPVPHVFPDLALELKPGEAFKSAEEIHHFYVEIRAGDNWVSTYQGEDIEILQGPEPELVEPEEAE